MVADSQREAHAGALLVLHQGLATWSGIDSPGIISTAFWGAGAKSGNAQALFLPLSTSDSVQGTIRDAGDRSQVSRVKASAQPTVLSYHSGPPLP